MAEKHSSSGRDYLCSGARAASPSQTGRGNPERSEEHTSELQSRRDLHAVPTRRSSDLIFKSHILDVRAFSGVNLTHSAGYETVNALNRIAETMRGWQKTSRLQVETISVQERERRRRPKRAEENQKDRKSTRLNSSHAEIYTLSLHDALPI